MNKGFSLIELLVVLMIMGILITLSIFGISGARESARDTQRKTDLEQIRSAVELYKSDCGLYPGAITFGSSLVNCTDPTIKYIEVVPQDPVPAQRQYSYKYDATTNTYALCASLEKGTGTIDTCNSCQNASYTTGTIYCNYKTTNP